jgi:hypothetical protein
MSRRNRAASFSPLWIGLGVGAVLLLAGAYFFLSFQAQPFRTASRLDPHVYASSAWTLRGNTYKLEAVVDNILAISPTEGRLVSVRLDNGRHLIPLLVTPEFQSINLQKEQRYVFLANVGDQGILRTVKVSKP